MWNGRTIPHSETGCTFSFETLGMMSRVCAYRPSETFRAVIKRPAQTGRIFTF